MGDFLLYYMVVAVSTAIFVLFKIYYPAIKDIKTKASNNAEYKSKMLNLLQYPNIGAIFFLIIAIIFTPVFVPIMLSDNLSIKFKENFIKGASK
ncbi:MAG: hypothetical protein E4H07_09665 [Nitrosomonadales bacterium]|nr:MAG: hypothetical protein E4H07_09665 [Nitrosomonadales bacterium]